METGDARVAIGTTLALVLEAEGTMTTDWHAVMEALVQESDDLAAECARSWNPLVRWWYARRLRCDARRFRHEFGTLLDN